MAGFTGRGSPAPRLFLQAGVADGADWIAVYTPEPGSRWTVYSIFASTEDGTNQTQLEIEVGGIILSKTLEMIVGQPGGKPFAINLDTSLCFDTDEVFTLRLTEATSGLFRVTAGQGS